VGSRIKAMTVAGLTTAEIAGRLHTCADNISMFQKLFFEVGDYVGDRHALAAILSPMVQQTSAVNVRERVWLVAALYLGSKGLDYVMDQRIRLSTQEQEEISDAVHCILAEQTLSYTLSLQMKPDAGAEVMDAYHKSQEMRLRNPPPDDSKRNIFVQGLVAAVQEKREPGDAAAQPSSG
jgi:hypothetical protein